MKLKQARETGIACGLEHNCEHVNNIVAHAISIWPYNKIASEIAELIEDAKKNGVKFAKCGCADFHEGNDLCYICKKFLDFHEGTAKGKRK